MKRIPIFLLSVGFVLSQDPSSACSFGCITCSRDNSRCLACGPGKILFESSCLESSFCSYSNLESTLSTVCKACLDPALVPTSESCTKPTSQQAISSCNHYFDGHCWACEGTLYPTISTSVSAEEKEACKELPSNLKLLPNCEYQRVVDGVVAAYLQCLRCYQNYFVDVTTCKVLKQEGCIAYDGDKCTECDSFHGYYANYYDGSKGNICSMSSAINHAFGLIIFIFGIIAG